MILNLDTKVPEAHRLCRKRSINGSSYIEEVIRDAEPASRAAGCNRIKRLESWMVLDQIEAVILYESQAISFIDRNWQ